MTVALERDPTAAATQTEIDLRVAPRYPCPDRPAVKTLAQGTYRNLLALVRDVSLHGVGLLVPRSLPPGSLVLLRWHFGPPQQWRNLPARVVHVTPAKSGLFVLGCTFAIPLEEAELNLFLKRTNNHTL